MNSTSAPSTYANATRTVPLPEGSVKRKRVQSQNNRLPLHKILQVALINHRRGAIRHRRREMIAKDGWIFAQAVTARFAKATPFASGPNTVTLNTAIATAATPIAIA
jgi:hypothetical protein